jgi:hypothetical protein
MEAMGGCSDSPEAGDVLIFSLDLVKGEWVYLFLGVEDLGMAMCVVIRAPDSHREEVGTTVGWAKEDLQGESARDRTGRGRWNGCPRWGALGDPESRRRAGAGPTRRGTILDMDLPVRREERSVGGQRRQGGQHDAGDRRPAGTRVHARPRTEAVDGRRARHDRAGASGAQWLPCMESSR